MLSYLVMSLFFFQQVLAFSSSSSGSGRDQRSILLQSVSKFEIVEIENTPYLSPHHPLSISPFANHQQPGANRPREFPSSISFSLSLSSYSTSIDIHLRLNTELIHPEYTSQFQYWDEQGVRRPDKEPKEKGKWDIELCYYYGSFNESESKNKRRNIDNIAIHTCYGGLSGHFVHARSNRLFLIEPAHLHLSKYDYHNYLASTASSAVNTGALHVVFEYDEVLNLPVNEAVCGVKGDMHSLHIKQKLKLMSPSSSSSASSSSSLNSDINDKPESHFHVEYGTSQKWVETLFVNDHSRYLKYSTLTEVSTIALANTMNSTYMATSLTPPIQVVIIGQITFLANDPWTLSYGTCSACVPGSQDISVDELLNKFLAWRSNKANVISLNPHVADHDNAHLLSALSFEKPTLGYASVGGMCSPPYSGGIEKVDNALEFFNAMISTHEMGHNFNMKHDSDSNACPSSGYIMNAVVSGTAPTQFSSCSVNYQNLFMDSTITCLDNKPTRLDSTGSVCGNGFIETGEQCDCGGGIGGSCMNIDPCCNGTTCQYVKNATCSASQACCDSSTCTIKTAHSNTVCRPASNPCDLLEMCDGTSGNCPDDYSVGPGTPCDTGAYGSGLCYAGACLNYQQQCREVGSSGPYSPYDTCSSQANFNGGNFCGLLWCSPDQSNCYTFPANNVVTSVASGVPCGIDPSTNYPMQCKSGMCVSSENLDPSVQWSSSSWTDCVTCDEVQTRNVTCVDAVSGVAVKSQRCSPFNKPSSTQKCVNLELGCTGAPQGGCGSTDLQAFNTCIKRNTIIISTVGAIVLVCVLLGIAYQSVTYLSEEDHQFEIKLAKAKPPNK